jgi:Ni/Fe-hydrogenase subunit HybB-like protein
MLTLTGTDFKAHLAVLAALIGVAAMSPVRWRTGAERAWSYGVYYVGYRLLSLQLTCGSWAVSALPLVAKHG